MPDCGSDGGDPALCAGAVVKMKSPPTALPCFHTILAIALTIGPGTFAGFAGAAESVPPAGCELKPGALNPGDYSGAVAIDSLIPNGDGTLHIRSSVDINLSVDEAGTVSGSWGIRSANFRTDVDLQVDFLLEDGKVTGSAKQLDLVDGHGTYTTTQDGEVFAKTIQNGRVSGTDLGGTVKIESIRCDEVSGSHAGAQGPLTDSEPTPVTLTKTGCSEVPTIIDSNDVNTINASTVNEFLKNARYDAGGAAAVGHLKPEIEDRFEFDGKNNVKKVNYTLKTKIAHPRWALGHPLPTEQQRALLNKAVELIKAHEIHHREIARQFAQKAVCAAVGRSEGAARKIITETNCDGFRAQEKFDLEQGSIAVVLNSKAEIIDVKTAPLDTRPNYSKFPDSGC
ncbi:hypothetical protein GCM10010347_63170 [Streptomyces cirratus]|uniref:DUF922 domain-containing protein n=1 Tax=Streptomyces cirratus TaxID=68187 RepID=A0ABQ3F3J7_9ACTN|nr:hypothetical protein GCM10010347_63170 [Streptomyces cirratus]